ncbi:hypothetical protein EDB89DRAFT_1915982 [Lactarius sanguifluus]|nr:hypothetical protein EDB89DRAFT_1915982 [Lactarius sanguifluus]
MPGVTGGEGVMGLSGSISDEGVLGGNEGKGDNLGEYDIGKGEMGWRRPACQQMAINGPASELGRPGGYILGRGMFAGEACEVEQCSKEGEGTVKTHICVWAAQRYTSYMSPQLEHPTIVTVSSVALVASVDVVDVVKTGQLGTVRTPRRSTEERTGREDEIITEICTGKKDNDSQGNRGDQGLRWQRPML